MYSLTEHVTDSWVDPSVKTHQVKLPTLASLKAMMLLANCNVWIFVSEQVCTNTACRDVDMSWGTASCHHHNNGTTVPMANWVLGDWRGVLQCAHRHCDHCCLQVRPWEKPVSHTFFWRRTELIVASWEVQSELWWHIYHISFVYSGPLAVLFHHTIYCALELRDCASALESGVNLDPCLARYADAVVKCFLDQVAIFGLLIVTNLRLLKSTW